MQIIVIHISLLFTAFSSINSNGLKKKIDIDQRFWPVGFAWVSIWTSFHWAVRRLTARSCEALKPRDLGLDFYNHSEIWQAARQQGCRDAFECPSDIPSLQYPISRLRDFETKFGGKTSYRLMNRGSEVNIASLPVKWTELDFVQLSPYRGDGENMGGWYLRK